MALIRPLFSFAALTTADVKKLNDRLEKVSKQISGGQDPLNVDYSYLMTPDGVLNPILVNDVEKFGILQDPIGNELVTYKVVEGDTVESIAKKFGIKKETILNANPLPNQHFLKIGQELLIIPVDGVIHKVSKGETLSKIASMHDVTTDKVIEFNLLTDDGFIRAGDILIIPGGKPVSNSGSRYAGSSAKSRVASLYDDLPNYDGYYIYPTVANSRNWGTLHGHNGDDMATPCGNEIYASAGGVIRKADGVGYNGGYGKYVIIDHDNQTSTLYAHMSKILVEVGDAVSQGDVIGKIGTTGRSTGCHVHFEVRGAKNPFVKY